MRTLGVPLPVTMYDIDSPGSNVNLLDSVMFPPVGHRIEWTTTPELASTVAVVDVVSTHTSAAFVVALYGVASPPTGPSCKCAKLLVDNVGELVASVGNGETAVARWRDGGITTSSCHSHPAMSRRPCRMAHFATRRPRRGDWYVPASRVFAGGDR